MANPSAMSDDLVMRLHKDATAWRSIPGAESAVTTKTADLENEAIGRIESLTRELAEARERAEHWMEQAHGMQASCAVAIDRAVAAESARDAALAKQAESDGLTFSALRSANVARLAHFKNRHGVKAHAHPTGSDWSPAQWLQAVVGELGEYANLRKKVERGDYTIEEALPELANELADVVIYLDLLAFRLDIDLGEATISKWNKKSAEIGYDARIDAAMAKNTTIFSESLPPAPAGYVQLIQHCCPTCGGAIAHGEDRFEHKPQCPMYDAAMAKGAGEGTP